MTQSLEVRMAHLEGAYEQINHRLGNVERSIDDLRSEVATGINGLRSAFDRKFLWMIGLIVVSILIPLTQRFLGH